MNGTTPMPKYNDLHTLLGAVKVKDYKCPNCGKWHNDNDEQYESEGCDWERMDRRRDCSYLFIHGFLTGTPLKRLESIGASLAP